MKRVFLILVFMATFLMAGDEYANWKFDECEWSASGDVIDDSGNGYHGNPIGKVSTIDDSKVCNAGNFDGSNDNIETTYYAKSSQKILTLSYWVKPNSINGAYIGSHDGNNHRFYLGYKGDRYIQTGFGNKYKRTNAKISVGEWNHLVMVADGSKVKTYLNGQLTDGGTFNYNFSGDSSTAFHIGKLVGGSWADGTGYINGVIDEVRIFNKALSATEVMNLYTNENNGKNYDGSDRNCNECDFSQITIFNDNEKNFELINPEPTRNIYGNIATIGNTALCVTVSKTQFDQACTENINYVSNNYFTKYMDIDSDSNTFNSTSAILTIPAKSKVVWAALFWQGFVHKCNDTDECRFRDDTTIINNNVDLKDENYDAHKILFLTPNSNGYKTVQAKRVDYIDHSNGSIYGAYQVIYDPEQNITEINSTNPNGQYMIANIQSHEGLKGFGNFSAWSMVVIYENEDEKIRNISVFEGFKKIHNEDEVITISGFKTPKHGPIDSWVSIFAGEGEHHYGGSQSNRDTVSIDGNYLSNNVSPIYNIFNSTISGFAHNPTLLNNNGIDIDNLNASSFMRHNQTSVNLKIESRNDAFYPSMITFNTELYVPKICYEEHLYDTNGKPIQDIILGDDIRFETFFRNKLDSFAEAEGALVEIVTGKYLEFNPNEHNISMTQIYDTNTTPTDENFTVKTPNIGDDIVDYDSNATGSDTNFYVRIGVGANANNGGILGLSKEQSLRIHYDVNESDSNISLENHYYISFSSEATGKLPRGKIKPCSDFSNILNVGMKGKFRIIEGEGKTSKALSPTVWNENWRNSKLQTKIAKLNAKYCILAGNSEEDTAIANNRDFNVDISLIDKYRDYDLGVVQNNLSIPTGHRVCFEISIPTYYYFSKAMQFKIVDTNNTTNEAESDGFALRPNRFEIDTDSTEFYAGEKLKLTFRAVDKSGNVLKGYDEKEVNLPKAPSFTKSTATPPNCIKGITVFDKNITFLEGSDEMDFKYMEVGDLNITIKENNLSSYAVIDKNDTLDEDRIITKKIKKITFKPYKLKISSTYNGDFGAGVEAWLYMGGYPERKISIDSNITALAKDNNITTNFKSNCVAKDVNISYDINYTNSSINMNYNLNGSETNSSVSDINNTITVNASSFSQGVATSLFEYNVIKPVSVPINPLTIAVNDANITSLNLSKEIENFDINRVTNFYYARIRAKNIKTKELSVINPIEIEVFDNGGSNLINGFKRNTLNWYRNSLHNTTTQGKIINITPITNLTFSTTTPTAGLYNLNIISNDTTSKNETINLNIDHWLWYSKFGNDYDFSATCSSHPCFQYIYIGNQEEKGVISGTFSGSDLNGSNDDNYEKKGIKVFR